MCESCATLCYSTYSNKGATLRPYLLSLLCLTTLTALTTMARPCESDADCASPADVCKDGYCVSRRTTLAVSDCNPARKDPPAPSDPPPPKDAPPPGGYNPKV